MQLRLHATNTSLYEPNFLILTFTLDILPFLPT
jgi:hypothetical protein